MADDAQLSRAIEHVSACMDEILGAFRPGAKITVMVRRPGEPTRDFMLTSDDMPEIRAMLDRRDSASREGEARLLATTASPGRPEKGNRAPPCIVPTGHEFGRAGMVGGDGRLIYDGRTLCIHCGEEGDA